jgi:DNA-binding NtrC family response regulator
MMPISYTKPIQIEYEIDVSEGIPPGLCIMAKRGDYNFPDESGYLVNFQEKENVVWVKKMGHPIHAVNCDFASLRGKRKISISVVNGTISLSIDNKVIISHYDTDYPTDPGYNGLMFCIPGNSQCTLKNLKIFESNDTIALHNTLTQTVRLSGNGDRYYRVAKSTTTWGSEPVWVYQFINITEYVKLLNKYRILENEKQRLQDEINKQNGVFAGKSEAVQKIIEKAKTIAAYPVTILIEGETGCGKEVLAKHVHDLSERRNKPFVKLDCTTLPPNLMETELFGHEKGAFTGADKMRIGRIEQADGGTLFIDEISNLSLSAQAKLLDFLHSFEISRIGSNRRTKVNVRVIAASNIPLQLMVKKKLFREDLFYRINSIQITIPPLRERKIDIPVLAELFVNEACVTLKKEKKKLDPEVFPVLMTRKWPGNARELRSVIFEAVMLAEGNEISPANVRIGGIKETITSKRKKRVSIQTITDALNEAGGNIAKAAKKLGIGRMTIYRKVLRNQAT